MNYPALRSFFAVRSVWAAVVPFIISLLLGWFWLRPQLVADTEEHQRQLAGAIASRIDDYLVASSSTITGAASIFSNNLISRGRIQAYMDSVLASSMDLTSITVTDSRGRISHISLPREKARLREELTGIDLSLTDAVSKVSDSGKPAWSDAYLSPVGGGLTVAYATPAGQGIALGEISLARLSTFLRSLDIEGRDLIFILDRRGQVIADGDGRYTARQHNLTNLEIVRRGLASEEPVTHTFEFNGGNVVGCMLRAPILDWHILVTTPLREAYGPTLTIAGIFVTALCLALLLASGLAFIMSHSITSTLTRLVSYAGRIEAGENPGEWQKAPVREFNMLGDALHAMAFTLGEREKRLNTQLNFLQQLIDSIPIPVYYKDTAGLYLGCNSAFEEFFGLTRQEIVGRTVYDILPGDQADRHHQADSALLSRGGVQTYEVSGFYGDGRYHDVIFNKAIYVDEDNVAAGMVGAVIDITSRKKAEEERKLLEAQLHQAQKMEAVGQLAGGIAHDFNNILTAIIGYAEMILMRMERDSKSRHYMEQIVASADRAAELTNGLLAFSRKQFLNAQPLDLCEVVRGLETMLARLLPEDIEFRNTLPEETLVVMADKGQIQQVLVNLVTNGRDAMRKGGTLSIEVRPVDMDRESVDQLGFGEPGSYALVSVSDTGHGMDENTRGKIFEPFFTTKEVGKGTGLGMAIVYGIIQQHNGHIAVSSEPGRGTTFSIYLPRVGEVIADPPPSLQPEVPPGGTETVLLAEDEGTVLELHRIVLEEAGYKVIGAADGRDALEKFAEYRDEVDVLITDVVMPGINGKILYDQIRKTKPDIRVLFMSGHPRDITMERGVPDGGINYLRKPVKASELLKALRGVLSGDSREHGDLTI